MKLIHTLLFLLRENRVNEDLLLAQKCLKSLEKSTYKTVLVYNQGFWSNEELLNYLKAFNLHFIIVGNGINVGTVLGRQSCFEKIWQEYTEASFISEIHLDMIFAPNWEDELLLYLENNDEPMISCGIVDQKGDIIFLNKNAGSIPNNLEDFPSYLAGLTEDVVVHGFTNPCIHRAEIIKQTGGYNPHFLTGKQAFEDDSMLLGYYYYYGTRANWKPKVCFKTVVYHEIAGQRMGMGDSVMVNYEGLVKQYGAMGLKHLSELHKSQWHINYFSEQYRNSFLNKI